jgi:hypothetical protein
LTIKNNNNDTIYDDVIVIDDDDKIFLVAECCIDRTLVAGDNQTLEEAQVARESFGDFLISDK